MDGVSGVILAGGASRRMGRDKAWVEFLGRSMIERVIGALNEVCDEIIVVANDGEKFASLHARVVPDILTGKGSLGGIYSGLRAAEYDRALVVACDMPLLNVPLLDYLIRLSPDFDVVIPSAADPSKPKQHRAGLATAKDNDLHPLHAVYAKECLAPIETRLAENDLRMISFHPDVRVRVVDASEMARFDPQYLSLFNANTPEELESARTLQSVAHRRGTE